MINSWCEECGKGYHWNDLYQCMDCERSVCYDCSVVRTNTGGGWNERCKRCEAGELPYPPGIERDV